MGAGPAGPVVLEAQGVGIRFHRNRRKRMQLRELLIKGHTGPPSREEFWALRDVSFQVRTGEAVGVVGPNGTGKSTLLKIIAGVLIPDEGTVSLDAGVAPLIELTGGFAGELTARENIHLLAGIHGLPKRVIQERFDEIVDFAEVRDSLDTPFRHFSSGMKVRLGFAVVTQLDEPVILVDEVLAVGDRVFKEKCYGRIEELLADGRTLFLVSHNENDLRRFCERGLYLRQGRLVVDGPIDEAIDAYHADDPRKAARAARA
jgi:ABC-type polysaccharide/polyol phosphate transport system ATPase subunit